MILTTNRSRTQLDTLYEKDEHLTLNHENKNGGNCCSAALAKPAYLKHKEIIDVDQAEQDLQAAKDEWDMVSPTLPVLKQVETITPPISFDEVLTYFRTRNMTPFLKYIKPVKQRNRFSELMRWFMGIPKLRSNLIQERDLIFAIAHCPFDSSETVHLRVLQTLYKTLTGSQRDCPRYGSHWEEIGFQGIDPGTDLRGVGFLGLNHLLYFVLNPLTAELSKEIMRLAHSDKQDFPFCVMGINITRIVLETLREEVLNKECNRRKDIFLVTNEFYVGIYLQLFKIWKEQKKAIMDSGFVLKDLSALAKTRPSVVFQQLNDYTEGKLKFNAQSASQCFSDIGGISLKPSADML